MISNIKIENFKSLKSVDVSGLKGLNVFWGKNNSGKSAIMQAILLLKQSIKSNEIKYNGDIIKLGSFETVSFGRNAENIIKIDIEFVLSPGDTSELCNILTKLFKKDAPILKELNAQSIHYCIEFGKRVLIETVSDSGGNILGKFEHLKDGHQNRAAYFPRLTISSAPSSFVGNGILDWVLSSGLEPAFGFVAVLKKILGNEFNNIYFISTERGIGERIQALRGLKDINAGVGIRGENTISVIHHLRNNDITLFEEIVRRASEFGIKLTTRIDGSDTSVICRDEILPIDVNVVDAGFGLNQLLPIIVQSYIAGERSTILIEEPETHLHEGAQYKLLDMFLDIIGKGKQAIITSHSVALRSRTIRNYHDWQTNQTHPGIEQVQFYNIKLDSSGSIITSEPLETMDIRDGRQVMSQEDYDGSPG